MVTFAIGLALGLTARELAVSAYAQAMDPGRQRQVTNEGIAQLSNKMDEVLDILRNGTLKVKVASTDKSRGAAPASTLDAAGTDRPSRSATPAPTAR